MEQTRSLRENKTSHFLEKILYSSKAAMIVLRCLLLMMLFISGLSALRVLFSTLKPPIVYQKDLLQEYLMARALIEGVDPYTPLSELGNHFLGSYLRIDVDHPTPHPLAIALITFPLGYISFRNAAIVWFLLELLFLFASVFILFRNIGIKSKFIFIPLISLFFWWPIFAEFYLGQLMTLILVLLVGVWTSLRNGKEVLAGFLLGCSIAFKFLTWPILLLLLLKKKWKPAIVTIISFIVINGVSGILFGFHHLANYYLSVSKTIALLYRPLAINSSLWSYGWRFFAGSLFGWVTYVDLPPIISAPAFAAFASTFFPLVLLIIIVIFSRRLQSFDNAFAIFIVVSIIISPISWSHYYVLALIPLFVIARSLVDSFIPLRESLVLLMIFIFHAIPDQYLYGLIEKIAITHSIQGYYGNYLYIASLLSFLPILPPLLLIWLLFRSNCQLHNPPDLLSKGESKYIKKSLAT